MGFWKTIGSGFKSVGSGIATLGKKAYGGAVSLGKKISNPENWRKLGNKVAEGAGVVAKYGAMAMPVLAAIPGVGEVAAGVVGAAGAVSALGSGVSELAGGIQGRNINQIQKGGGNVVKSAMDLKSQYKKYRTR